MSVSEKAKPAGTRVRRTQAERSDSMRRKLVDAALHCLAEDGYAGITIARVVARAKVSHGATGHHFPSKSQLIVAAAETLVRRTYRVMGELLLGIVDEDDRLEALVRGSWERIYSRPPMRAYLELSIASQRDPALAAALLSLSQRTEELFENAVDHYFERRTPQAEDPRSLFTLLELLLVGLSSQAHLLKDKRMIEHQLAVWTRLMGQHLRARRGVTSAPPRPPAWER